MPGSHVSFSSLSVPEGRSLWITLRVYPAGYVITGMAPNVLLIPLIQCLQVWVRISTGEHESMVLFIKGTSICNHMYQINMHNHMQLIYHLHKTIGRESKWNACIQSIPLVFLQGISVMNSLYANG